MWRKDSSPEAICRSAFILLQVPAPEVAPARTLWCLWFARNHERQVVCTEQRPWLLDIHCRVLERHRAANRRCHSCVSYGFRHLGPVSTNVLVISDPAMLIDGTPEETTFPRPRLSAQSQAKLLSPAPACKWAPSQMNASESRAMQCPGPQLLMSTKTAVDCTQGSRAQRLVSR